MAKITKKAVLIIAGVTVLTGGVAAGTTIALTKLIKKHAELGMTKAEVLKKLGDPDHTSESGDYWYYFERKIGKKYKEKDELEHTWNEANQIKAQSIGLELEIKHFESKIVQFNSDNVVVSYFYNTDTKYTYNNEKFSSWTEKTTKQIKTDIPSGMNCYVYSEDKDGNYHYLIVDDNFKNSFNYEAKFEDKSLLKFSNNTSFDVTGPKNNIHFDWKYDNINLSSNVDLNAYDARIVAQSESKGVTITGDGLYNIGDKVELKAEVKPGYLGKGWDTDVSYFLGDRISTHLTDESIYSFNIENFGKKEYEFLTDLEVYTVTYNINGGINSQNNPNTFTVEDEIILADPYYLNHEFLGWFDENGSRIFEIKTGTLGNIVISALFSGQCMIFYNLNGGNNNPDNPMFVNDNQEFVLFDAVKQGYIFDGWFDNNGNQISIITNEISGIVILSAQWTARKNNLSVVSDDTSKGIVSITSGSGYSDESITIVASPIGECVFKGWYHESVKISNEATYTFIMPPNDYSLVARFFTKEEEEEERAQHYGTKPIISNDGKIITYGLYPQWNVNDSTLVSALNTITTPELNGWYFYEGDYYAKVSAITFGTSYKFDNHTEIVNGTTYWFKCSPIEWEVLSENNGEYLVVSRYSLDAHYYYNVETNRTIDAQTIYLNNYKYSDIRTWLNVNFYNSAFALGNEHIQTKIVNNSASTTNSSNNSYACSNTNDNVFLLSYQDYMNTSYGFSWNPSRYCIASDWARARGAHINNNAERYSYYWTRSPSSDYSNRAWCVHDNGSLHDNYVYYSGYSVRPGLSIKIA